jgi:hypothetical protein
MDMLKVKKLLFCNSFALEVTHPQQLFFSSAKTFKSIAFAKRAAAHAAVTWALKYNEAATTVTLPTESSTIFHVVMTSKGIIMHRIVLLHNYVLHVMLHQGHGLIALLVPFEASVADPLFLDLLVLATN